MLFELTGARYERRSILITANRPVGEWNRIFQDLAKTLVAADRPVHNATIVEIDVDSYRRHPALDRKQRATKASPNTPTIGASDPSSRRDNQTENRCSATKQT
jgi:hypothetical protein